MFKVTFLYVTKAERVLDGTTYCETFDDAMELSSKLIDYCTDINAHMRKIDITEELENG